MSRMKCLFAVLVVAVIAGLATQASAQVNVKVILIGASGSWQAMGVAGYRAGLCPSGASQCKHYTDSKWTVVDSRPVSLGGTATSDGATIWMLWDHNTGTCTSTTPCNVWVYAKVDSIVGNRCFFAQPRCTIAPTAGWGANMGQITLTGTAWGNDTVPPANIQTFFNTAQTVQAAASEIRPEDAMLGQCRINSAAGGGSDGLNGLGDTGTGATPNPSGTCPSFGAIRADLQGDDLISGIPTKSGHAHPNAFNISGTDPFTGTAVPAFSTVQVGAVPLVFITNRGTGAGPLASVKDVTLSQLQDAFSGNNCNGPALGGAAGAINVFSREPLSGTMNAAEYTAFRLPRGSGGGYAGVSQETGLTSNFQVTDVACSVGGSRWQGIGQGDLNFGLANSNSSAAEHNRDGIGYTFFSYGNVAQIGADNSTFRYLTINGVDPIFSVYNSTYDTGENGSIGQLPGQADLTLCANKLPCSERKIWKGGYSFPNLRNGSYRQWAMIRLIGDTGSAPFTAAKALSTFAQTSVVTTVPDFVPFAAVTGAVTDPGLKLLRSHYTQQGVAPNNQTDVGGDEGGCIQATASLATKLVQREFGCAVGP